jgi:hypothetical protein
MAKRSILVFMTPADEEAFEGALLRRCPDLRFLDNNVWPDREPLVRSKLSDCTSKFVFLWSPSVKPDLPTLWRADGALEGPTAGCVVEFTRSKQQKDDLLDRDEILSGRLAAGYDPEDEAAARFVKAVWAAYRSLKPVKLLGLAEPDENPAMFSAGPDAAEQLRRGSLRLREGIGYFREKPGRA